MPELPFPPAVPIAWYLTLSAILFSLGVLGFMGYRRRQNGSALAAA